MNWLLTLSYFVHLLATVIWLGGLALTLIMVLPAMQTGKLGQINWLAWRQAFIWWVNGSLVALLISGFYQMTVDPNYGGFLVLDGIWAWAMLLKHIAYAGMVGISLYLQFGLYPAIERANLLAQKKPNIAKTQQQAQFTLEKTLVKLNGGLATAVLFFTAMATAV